MEQVRSTMEQERTNTERHGQAGEYIPRQIDLLLRGTDEIRSNTDTDRRT